MIGIIVTMAALAGAPDSAATVHEVEFAPLLRSERAYARLGPVGPFYPQAAATSKLTGEATLECRVEASGVLKRCKVISETPAGLSFGVAARVMADRGRISAAGSPPPGQTIRVRVPFSLDTPANIAP